MRVAIGGLHTECSTYNPVPMTTADFRVLRGDEITAHPEFAELHDHPAEWLPTLHARAIAGGPVARAVYDAFKAEFLDRLRALGPVDGLYLAMHGAVFVAGMEDAEADWIEAARDVVGPDCLVAAGYDLHGNLSQRIFDALDMFTSYRTAPHIDQRETQRRAVTMLLRALHTGARPGIVWAPVPVLWPGERTSTTDEPARSLYAGLPAVDAVPGVWDASLQVGYVWADEMRATACAVLTGTDRAVLAREAAALATAYWDARKDFVFGTRTGTLAACVAEAVGSATAPVVLAESGDNPTGGGVGDRGDMLRALMNARAEGAILAGIADRPATDAAYDAGEGAPICVDVGATLDPSGVRVAVDGTVRRLLQADDPAERQAVLQVGGIALVVTARRRPFHAIADFTRLGLDPLAARIVAVKSGYLSPELAPIANPALMALSPGVVDQDVARLPRHRKAHPTYPFDPDATWRPQPVASRRLNEEGALR